MTLIPIYYNSVSEMIRATSDPEYADEFDAYVAARELVSALMLLRASHGVTQAELAARMGCGQAKVSKLEQAKDADLRIGDVVAFARALGKGVKLVLGDGDGLTIEVEGKPQATTRKRVRK